MLRTLNNMSIRDIDIFLEAAETRMCLLGISIETEPE
jgi:DNA repair photolyase